jgi:photosystem II stability/assembly factor-like uncharacterized protein
VFATSDGKRAWAVGRGGTVLESDDGQQWRARDSGGKRDLFSVFGTSDGKYVWVVGEWSTLLESRDGVRWTPQVGLDATPGTLLESRDGVHWTQRTRDVPMAFWSVFSTPDGRQVWAVGSQGSIALWAAGSLTGFGFPRVGGRLHEGPMPTLTPNELRSVFETSDGKRVWAAGDNGTILEATRPSAR